MDTSNCIVCGCLARTTVQRKPTCIDCKKFFNIRRDISRYDCIGLSQCDKQTIKYCVRCRYTKCMAVGMKPKLWDDTPHHMTRKKKAELEIANQNYVFNCLPESNGTNNSLFPNGAFKNCEVCEVKIGVFCIGDVCGACKCFFKRIKNPIVYECSFNNDCIVTPESRTDCILCRYMKCLRVGMKHEEDVPNLVPSQLVTLDVANKVSTQIWKAYETYSSYSKLEIAPRKAMKLKLRIEGLSCIETNRLNAWQLFSGYVAYEIQQTTGFMFYLDALKENLDVEEQADLLKNNAFSVFLLRIVRGLSSKGLVLFDGHLISPEDLQLLYGELSGKIESFAWDLARYSENDFAVLIVLVMCQLAENETSSKHLEVYKYYSKVISRSVAEKYEEFEMRVLELNELNKEHEKIVDYLKENLQFLDLNPLFKEVFNIQKPKETDVDSDDDDDSDGNESDDDDSDGNESDDEFDDSDDDNDQ